MSDGVWLGAELGLSDLEFGETSELQGSWGEAWLTSHFCSCTNSHRSLVEDQDQ